MGDTAQRPEPEVLKVPEVAALLRLAPKSVYELISLGKIPGVQKVGRVIRVHRPTLVAWLASGERLSSKGRR